jgi:restriction system protein
MPMARRRTFRRRSTGVSPAALLALTAVGAATAYPWVALALGLVALIVLISVWALRRSRQRREREAMLQLELTDVDAMDPLAFESLVAHLLNAQGFRTQLTKATGDYGVDVVASIGSRRIAVQVKRYSVPVSAKAIGEVLVGMPHYNCSECMVVTNSIFTRPAINAATPHPCTLVDRRELARWMVEALPTAKL